MLKTREKRFWIYIIVCVILVFSVLFASVIGSADLTVDSVFNVLKYKIFNIKDSSLVNSSIYIVWNLRLPRAILAISIGGGLAVAGAAMQSITQNVMADPYVLGVSSGALALVSIGFFIGGTFTQLEWFIPLLAFCGALLSLLLIFAIGGFSCAGSTSKLILSGMAVSITLNAVAQYFIYISAGNNKATSIISWMMGSLAGVRWHNLGIPFWGCIAGFIYFLFFARAFDLIALGDETAISLGTNVIKIKKFSIVVIALITGLAVASGGLIGLVGFVVPHIVRLIIGTEHKKLFPLVFLVGGIFLLWMDVLARTVLAPQEVPIGIFTALCGGPFFIYLLKKKMRKGEKLWMKKIKK